jgi:hypothetical protein
MNRNSPVADWIERSSSERQRSHVQIVLGASKIKRSRIPLGLPIMSRSIFADNKRRQGIAEIEFRYFRQRAVAEIPSICQSISRFNDLKAEFSFWTDTSTGEDHLQLNFGRRKMDVNDLEEKPAIEKGPSLVYSLGRAGDFTSTVLYPASSPLGSVEEDHIFIRIGSYSGHQLLSRLRSDIKDLVSYAFVSSLETDASLRDRIRYWWLRRTHPQQIEKKFVRPLSPSKFLAAASKFTLMSLIVALLRPIGWVLAYVLLLYLGFASLTVHLH